MSAEIIRKLCVSELAVFVKEGTGKLYCSKIVQYTANFASEMSATLADLRSQNCKFCK